MKKFICESTLFYIKNWISNDQNAIHIRDEEIEIVHFYLIDFILQISCGKVITRNESLQKNRQNFIYS